MNDVEIQRLSHDEADRLRRIRLRSLRDAPDAFASTYEETEARPAESWTEQVATLPTFVAVRNGVDVGIARGAPDDASESAAWLISMWIDPVARGQRIGERLIDAVVEWARTAGKSRLLLEVADENPSAIALYARMGFVPNGEVSTLPPPREHVREHQRVLEL